MSQVCCFYLDSFGDRKDALNSIYESSRQWMWHMMFKVLIVSWRTFENWTVVVNIMPSIGSTIHHFLFLWSSNQFDQCQVECEYKLHYGKNGHPWACAGCDVMQWHVPWQHDVWGQVQARERPSCCCWYLCWLLLCWINSTPRSPGSRLETPLTVFLGNVNKLCDRWNHFFAILADFGHVWDPSDFLHI